MLSAQATLALLKPCHHPFTLYIKNASCCCSASHLQPSALTQSSHIDIVLVSNRLGPAVASKKSWSILEFDLRSS